MKISIGGTWFGFSDLVSIAVFGLWFHSVPFEKNKWLVGVWVWGSDGLGFGFGDTEGLYLVYTMSIFDLYVYIMSILQTDTTSYYILTACD